jgi:hypothetical protein
MQDAFRPSASTIVIPVPVTGIHSKRRIGLIAFAESPVGMDPRHKGEDDASWREDDASWKMMPCGGAGAEAVG